MLITYLTLQQKGEPETAFISKYVIPSDTTECITAKIKDVLSSHGVSMAWVVGLRSDGVNVMVDQKARVALQLLQNDCPFLVNIHCGAHRTALAACDASTTVCQVSTCVTIVNNMYTHYKNSPIRTFGLNEIQKEIGEHNLLNLKQPHPCYTLLLQAVVGEGS